MRPTGIIVIGLDGLGKTSFVDIAVNLLGGTKVKFLDDPRTLTLQQKVERCLVEIDIVEATYKNSDYKIRIYDRCPAPDEWVYGPYLNDREFSEKDPYPNKLRQVEASFTAFNHAYLYITPLMWKPYEEMMKENPDDKVPTEVLKKIDTRYKEWFSQPSPLVKMPFYVTPGTWFNPQNVSRVLTSLFSRMGATF